MAEVLRVVEWSRRYENHQTRRLKRLEWVPVPNKMDGDGYGELIEHEDGPAHFGAWVAILEVASRCDPRGTLQRGGRALDTRSLARITRFPARVFEEAIPRLLAIGWLEAVTPLESDITRMEHASHTVDRADEHGTHTPHRAEEHDTHAHEGKGMEGNGRVESLRSSPVGRAVPSLRGGAGGEANASREEWKPRHYPGPQRADDFVADFKAEMSAGDGKPD